MKRLAVYCGASPGNDPAFADMARAMAAAMIEQDIELVYGGGRLGLMGIVADAVLNAGGRVYGVIPSALIDLEVGHPNLTEMHIVTTMHERKAKMTELTDAFVALPGGIGTLDELFEAWTWNALGFHAKPFALLNVAGFWDGLDGFMDDVVSAGFLSSARREQLLMAHSPEEAIKLLDAAIAGAAQGMIW